MAGVLTARHRLLHDHRRPDDRHARQVLAAWDRGWAEAEQAKARQRATLVAGMSTSPGRGGLLAAIRSRFTALHPEATVQLGQVSWDDPTAGLVGGTVDVAFVWLPLPGPDRYRWVVVAEEPRLVAMPDSHPLASRDVIDFADLLDEPFLALPPSAGPLRDYWLAADAVTTPARSSRTTPPPAAKPPATDASPTRHGPGPGEHPAQLPLVRWQTAETLEEVFG